MVSALEMYVFILRILTFDALIIYFVVFVVVSGHVRVFGQLGWL